jgi:hypothetical protein
MKAEAMVASDLREWSEADIRRLVSDLAAQNVKLKIALQESTALLQVMVIRSQVSRRPAGTVSG